MNTMKIRYAENGDMALLAKQDQHISKEEIKNAIFLRRIYLAEEKGRFAGWLRYNLFWDNIPFMNLLCILDEYQGRGFGRQLVEFWENEMARQGYETLMTSTQSNEYAQHFYHKLGYEAVGGFKLSGDSYEVIFSKGTDQPVQKLNLIVPTEACEAQVTEYRTERTKEERHD